MNRRERRLSWEENYSNYYLTSSTSAKNSSSLSPSPHSSCLKWLYKWLIFLILFFLLFSLLLWDMSHLRDLSQIIHDDHSSFWKTVHHRSWNKWLSPLDLCILKKEDQNYFPHRTPRSQWQRRKWTGQGHGHGSVGSSVDSQLVLLTSSQTTPSTSSIDYTFQNCSKFLPKSLSKKNYQTHPRVFCSVALGLGSECQQPFSPERSYYYKKLIQAITGNKTIYSLRSTMKSLARAKKAVVFIGDSVTKQSLQALFCEMLRIDPSVSFIGDVYHPHNVTMRWVNRPSGSGSGGGGPGGVVAAPLEMNLHYLSFHGMLEAEEEREKGDEEEEDEERGQGKDEGVKEKENGESQSKKEGSTPGVEEPAKPIVLIGSSGGGDPTNSEDTNTSHSVASTRDTRFLGSVSASHSHPSSYPSTHYDFSALKHTLVEYQERYSGGLVVVFNIGASYTSRMKYREDIGIIFEWLEKLGGDVGTNGGEGGSGSQQRNVVMYRETAAQHWNHTSSGYPLNEETGGEDWGEWAREEGEGDKEQIGNTVTPTDSSSSTSSPFSAQHHPSLHFSSQPFSQCVPITDYTPLMDWKNFEIKSCLKNNEYQHPCPALP
jgi:hypothetical protein